MPIADGIVLKKGKMCLVAIDLLHAVDGNLWDGELNQEVWMGFI